MVRGKLQPFWDTIKNAFGRFGRTVFTEPLEGIRDRLEDVEEDEGVIPLLRTIKGHISDVRDSIEDEEEGIVPLLVDLFNDFTEGPESVRGRFDDFGVRFGDHIKEAYEKLHGLVDEDEDSIKERLDELEQRFDDWDEQIRGEEGLVDRFRDIRDEFDEKDLRGLEEMSNKIEEIGKIRDEDIRDKYDMSSEEFSDMISGMVVNTVNVVPYIFLRTFERWDSIFGGASLETAMTGAMRDAFAYYENWDTPTGKEVGYFWRGGNPSIDLDDDGTEVTRLRFSDIRSEWLDERLSERTIDHQNGYEIFELQGMFRDRLEGAVRDIDVQGRMIRAISELFSFLRSLWEHTLHEDRVESLDVYDGVVYSGGSDCFAYAYEIETEEVLWDFEYTEGEGLTRINEVVHDEDSGNTYIGINDGRIYEEDDSTVELVHEIHYDDKLIDIDVLMGVEVDGDVVYSCAVGHEVGHPGKGVIAYDMDGEEEVWSDNDEHIPSMTQDDDYIYGYGVKLYQWDKADGSRTELHEFDTLEFVVSMIHSDGVIYCGFTDGTVLAYDLGEEDVIWEVQEHVDTEIQDLSISPNGEILFSVARDGRLVAYNIETGDVEWMHLYPYGLYAVASMNNEVYYGTKDAYVVALERLVDRVGPEFPDVSERFDEIGDRFDKIGELIEQSGQRFGNVRDKFGEVGDEFDGLREQADEVGTRFSLLSGRFENVGDRFDKISDATGNIGDTAEQMDGDVGEVVSEMEEIRDQFEELRDRIDNLEKMVR